MGPIQQETGCYEAEERLITRTDLPAYRPEADAEEDGAGIITSCELAAGQVIEVAEVIKEGVSPFLIAKAIVKAIASAARYVRDRG
jgi:hypothetical protein